MRNIKRNLGRYLGVGMAVLLVLTALYLPQGWFAFRDAASLGRVQGEALAPLMVAQLDRGYERDIHDRMCVYMEAYAQGDVNCSSKEIDLENESLWENIGQAENSMLIEALTDYGYVRLFEKAYGDSVIESCTQYVLMRQSDGQILLVANDICLDKGNGCRMELLIDGVDGTVYYLYSEEAEVVPLIWDWLDIRDWHWWWVLNDTYHTEAQKKWDEFYVDAEENGMVNISGSVLINEKIGEQLGLYDPESVQMFGYPQMWVSSVDDVDTYCCLLDFEDNQDSWTLEIETWGRRDKGASFLYQIRLGLPAVVNSIPEMAGRISLAEYDQINQEGAMGRRFREDEEREWDAAQ